MSDLLVPTNLRLTEGQRKFLGVRPAYVTDAAAARAVGVSTETVKTWAAKDEAFRKLRDEVIERSSNLLAQEALKTLRYAAGLEDKAWDTLDQVMDSGDVKEQRLAAGVVIDTKLRAIGATQPQSQQNVLILQLFGDALRDVGLGVIDGDSKVLDGEE